VQCWQEGAGKEIGRDWDDREFVEKIQLNILSMTDFLNRLDSSMHSKIAQLNEKLTLLEKKLQHVRAAVDSTNNVE
jgi:hypothetical protein